jgi:light-independent protochlorophyllide reductase subunit B
VRVRRGIYEGPGSHGILRVAASMRGVRVVYRALPEEWCFPALLGARTRSGEAAPVTLSPVIPPFEGSRAPGDFGQDISAAVRRHRPDVVVVARSDTALISGEFPPPLDFPPYRDTGRSPKLVTGEWETPDILEHEAAALMLFELVRTFANKPRSRTPQPSVNLFGAPVMDPLATAELSEVTRLLELIGVEVNATVPLGATAEDLARLPRAWANVVLNREFGEAATLYLQDELKLPRVATPVVGAVGTGAMLRAVGELCSLDRQEVERVIWGELATTARLPWYARITPPERLEGRRIGVFGDFTYSLGLGYTCARELGLDVAWSGTYLSHMERDFMWRAEAFTDEAFATDDPEEVASRAESAGLDLLIGTALEAPAAEALGIPFVPLCPPVNDYPLAPRPLMGYAGTNTIADTLDPALRHRRSAPVPTGHEFPWTEEALEELQRIPPFLRGRARRLAEEYAREVSSPTVTREIVEDSRL